MQSVSDGVQEREEGSPLTDLGDTAPNFSVSPSISPASDSLTPKVINKKKSGSL